MKFPAKFAVWLALAAFGLALCAAGGVGDARQVLRAALANETGWTRVHAAEALAACGEPAMARAVFLKELEQHGNVPHDRIGIHRVLARTAATAAARRAEVEWIGHVFADPAAPDRVHAMETLGKLGGPHDDLVLAAARDWLPQASEEDAVFLHWLLWESGDDSARTLIVLQLRSAHAATRLRAAYALRLTGTHDPVALAELARAADLEPAESPARAIVLGAAFQLQAAPSRLPAWRMALEQLVAAGSPVAAYDALQALMLSYGPADLGHLGQVMATAKGDVQITAAWALLLAKDRGAMRP